MKTMPAVTAAFLALAASAALSLNTSQARRIAPGSNWWISDAECAIQGNWGSPETDITTLWIEPISGGAYRFDIADTDWRDVPDDAPLEVGFGFDGGAPSSLGEALGYARDGGGQGFGLLLFEPALIDGLDDHRNLEIYRDGTLVSSLELGGGAEAVAAMNACAAAREEADAIMNASFDDEMSTNMSDGMLGGETLDDAEFAMNAAEAASLNAQATPEP